MQAGKHTRLVALESSVWMRNTRLRGQYGETRQCTDTPAGIPCSRVDGVDLVELLLAVKGHHLNALIGSKLEMGNWLAGMSVDDAAGLDTKGQDGLHLLEACTVEAGAERG